MMIAGGGLAGLTASFLFAKKGYRVALFEKNSFPFSKVCGEYVSNESADFLLRSGFPLGNLNAPQINSILLTSPSGLSVEHKLESGGSGLSHYTFEKWLSDFCTNSGVQIFEKNTVQKMEYKNDLFYFTVNNRPWSSQLAFAAYGRHSNLQPVNRSHSHTHFVGIKYYADADLPDGRLEMHLFPKGYCGIMKTDNGYYNICYLIEASSLKKVNGNIALAEKQYLFSNPLLKERLQSARKIHETPLVASQVYTGFRKTSDMGILLIGDCAGMVAPLCGNGMSMAIHSGKIASELGDLYLKKIISLSSLCRQYDKLWHKEFSTRMRMGQIFHHVIKYPFLSNITEKVFSKFPALLNYTIKQTHGASF